MSRIYDCILKNVRLNENGEYIGLKGRTVLSVLIDSPTISGSSVETVFKLPFGQDEDPKVTEESKGLLPAGIDYSVAHLDKRHIRVFKGSYIGEVEIYVTLAVTKSPSKIIPILKKILATALAAGTAAVPGVGGILYSTVVLPTATSLLEKNEVKDKVTILGKGKLKRDAATGDFIVELMVTKKDGLKAKRPYKVIEVEDGRTEAHYKRIPENFKIGTITLSFKQVNQEPTPTTPQPAAQT